MEQIYRIGIDHGYGNIKTAHHIFESGVIERERASELAGMTVEFEGKFYEIGSTHKEYQMDKVWDEDYYILTLAALAKELKGRGLCNASVILAAVAANLSSYRGFNIVADIGNGTMNVKCYLYH